MPTSPAPTDPPTGAASAAPFFPSPGVRLGEGEAPPGFDPFELATVLSHYDLGVIDAIHAFDRGSPSAPKALIRAERGRFLLKRRREGASSLERILFTHRVQLRLAERGAPLARLIGTRNTNSSVLEWRGGLYEVFEFVRGAAFDGRAAHAHSAGGALALLHAALAGFEEDRPEDSIRGYHGAREMSDRLGVIPERVARARSDGGATSAEALAQTVHNLADAYDRAASEADRLGVERWPRQVIHGDWHPGNLIYRRDGSVAAALDFDSARVEARAMDLANGALQFSITRGGAQPDDWPAMPDLDRLHAFIRGYDAQEPLRISRSELEALPWLMIEALIVEAIAPVAATGSFARMEGGAFLRMVERKVRWLLEHAADLPSEFDRL